MATTAAAAAARHIDHELNQQLFRGEHAKQEWVSCSYLDTMVSLPRTFEHDLWDYVYEPTDETKNVVESFLRRCEGKGYQVHPGCQGLQKSSLPAKPRGWYVEYNIRLAKLQCVKGRWILVPLSYVY